MFVFLQVLKLIMEATVKVKVFLRMKVSTTCIYRDSKKKSVQNSIFANPCNKDAARRLLFKKRLKEKQEKNLTTNLLALSF